MRVKLSMPVFVVPLVLALGCKDKEAASHRASTRMAPVEASARSIDRVVPEAIERLEPGSFHHGGDEGAALSVVGALPAWSAVTERYRLLKRRSQAGAVYGLVLEHEEEGLFRLVDATIGQGALSIPFSVPDNILVEPAMRVVLWGAWDLTERGDQESRWVWKATRAELLDDEPGPAFSPGMQAREQEAPAGLVLASKAGRRGGNIAFVVVERFERAGDGWLIADKLKGEPVARLLLPGETPSYGDQSSPGVAERWQLEVGKAYWLEIGRFRPASGDSLPVFQARGVPFSLPPEAHAILASGLDLSADPQ